MEVFYRNGINHGISGGTIANYPDQIKDLNKCSHVIIYVDDNDASNGNVIEYLEFIKEANIQRTIIFCNSCPGGYRFIRGKCVFQSLAESPYKPYC